jgi:uncharacterized membrane protein YkoI
MLKKRLLVGTTVAAVATGLIVGNLVLGPAFAKSTNSPTPTQCAVQSAADEAAVKGPDVDAVEEEVGDQDANVDNQAQEPSYSGSILVDESQYDGLNEADEAAALQSKATISAADAEAAVLAANPGTTVVKTELDNENGVLVYSVELSNGKDVKVDAGNGQILHTEAAGLDSESELEGQETAEN